MGRVDRSRSSTIMSAEHRGEGETGEKGEVGWITLYSDNMALRGLAVVDGDDV